MVAATREDILGLADKYHDPAAFDRASSLAWTHAQVQLHYLGIDHGEAHLYQQLANSLVYHDAALRPAQRTLQSNTLPISGLWRLGISGDRPIVLARIDDVDDRGLLRQLLTRARVLEPQGSRRRPRAAERSGGDLCAGRAGAPADARARRAVACEPRSPGGARRACSSFARTGWRPTSVCCCMRPPVPSSRARRETSSSNCCASGHPITAVREPPAALVPATGAKIDVPRLRFFNGLGGFTPDGREYVITLAKGQQTPLPWINVVANADFGFQASESGAGFTWALNSRENQLTPWSNDPVSSPPAEVFYIRDLASGASGRPTALPIRVDDATYIARFGQGYAAYEQVAQDVRCELDAIRRCRCAGQDLAARSDEPVGHRARARRHRLCRVGARRVACGQCAVHRDVDRPGQRRDSGAKPSQCGVRKPLCIPGVGCAQRFAHLRPRRIPRPQRAPRRAGSAADRCAALRTQRRCARSLCAHCSE